MLYNQKKGYYLHCSRGQKLRTLFQLVSDLSCKFQLITYCNDVNELYHHLISLLKRHNSKKQGSLNSPDIYKIDPTMSLDQQVLEMNKFKTRNAKLLLLQKPNQILFQPPDFSPSVKLSPPEPVLNPGTNLFESRDILLVIFSNFGPDTLATLCLVNKFFRLIAEDDSLWSQLLQLRRVDPGGFKETPLKQCYKKNLHQIFRDLVINYDVPCNFEEYRHKHGMRVGAETITLLEGEKDTFMATQIANNIILEELEWTLGHLPKFH